MPMPEIVTHCICPPIPIRDHDWTAFLDGKEDGAVGYGSTEQEAVADLMEQLEEEVA